MSILGHKIFVFPMSVVLPLAVANDFASCR